MQIRGNVTVSSMALLCTLWQGLTRERGKCTLYKSVVEKIYKTDSAILEFKLQKKRHCVQYDNAMHSLAEVHQGEM